MGNDPLAQLELEEGAMADKKHDTLPVHGYSPQSDDNVKLVNWHKQWEERALRHLDWLAKQQGIDQRWLAIGRTQLEKAFMAVNRSVFKPARITLPEDQDGSTLPSNQRPSQPAEPQGGDAGLGSTPAGSH